MVAQINSNLALFNPKIAQLYATGDAAEIVTKNGTKNNDEQVSHDFNKSLTGGRRVMFFGTNSSTGFQITFIDSFPRAVSMGYKRKELSIIPLVKPESNESTPLTRREDPAHFPSSENHASDTEPTAENSTKIKEYKYGSVVAQICVESLYDNFKNAQTNLRQFIATGIAAENLAGNEILRTHFENAAKMGASGECVEFPRASSPGSEEQRQPPPLTRKRIAH